MKLKFFGWVIVAHNSHFVANLQGASLRGCLRFRRFALELFDQQGHLCACWNGEPSEEVEGCGLFKVQVSLLALQVKEGFGEGVFQFVIHGRSFPRTLAE